MIQSGSCISVYSEMNPWIDFVVVIGAYCNFADAEEIVTRAYHDWWNNESDLPIADYIGSKLEENEIAYDIYFKNEEEDDEDDV